MRKRLTIFGCGLALLACGCGDDEDGFFGGGGQAPPVGLRIITQPTLGTPNTALGDFQVGLVDSNNNVVPVNLPVVLSLSTNPTGATLSGTTQGNTNNGTITFSNLSINLKGTYRITATIPGFGSVVSAPIQIGGGTPVLGAANNIALGFTVFFIHSADLNKDGRLDMVAINPDDNRFSVLLGTGAGNFGAPTAFATNQGPQDFRFGDWNRDGNLDLAITNFGDLNTNGTLNTVQLFQGNGLGGFAAPTQITAGTGAFDLDVGDFTGDSIVDLVVSNFGQANFSFFRGNGDGTFAAAANTNLPAGAFPTSPVARDFNNDGRLDVAIADLGNDVVHLFNGNGNGTFGAVQSFPITPPVPSPRGMASADFNGDGRADLVTANRDDNSVSVLLNNGAGFTVPPLRLVTGGAGVRPNKIAALDFNGDTRADILVTNSQGGNVMLFLGNGNGTFGAGISIPTGGGINANQPVGLDVADYNNDTNLDLAVGNYAQQFLTVLLQIP